MGGEEPVIAYGPRRVLLRTGDITRLDRPVDAIVSSDDNHLTHGGGVSAAIWAAAGTEIEQFVAREAPSLQLADVYRTPAGALRARHVLHAVTIDFDRNSRIDPRTARVLYGRVEDVAAQHGCASVATPLLGARSAGLDPEASVLAFAEAFRDRAVQHSKVKEVLLVVDEAHASICLAVLRAHAPPWRTLEDLVQETARATRSESSPGIARWLARPVVWDLPTGSGPTLFLFEDLLRVLLGAATVMVDSGGTPGHQGGDQERQNAVSPRDTDLSRLSGGQVFASAVEAYERGGNPLPTRLTATTTQALTARNQLVHFTGRDRLEEAQLARMVLRAVEEICIHLLTRSLIGTSPAKEPAKPPERSAAEKPAATRTEAPTATPAPPPKAHIRGTGLKPSTSGTAHVRMLHGFLLEALKPAAVDSIVEDLRAEGYRGDRDSALLEFCVRMRDPARFLTEHFPPDSLRDIARQATGRPLAASYPSRRAARHVLQSFGYPVPRRAVGLAEVTRRLKRRRSEVHAAGLVELKGIVADASSWLEYTTVVLLRFLCQAIYEEPAEPFLQKRGLLPHGTGLDRASLGTLLQLLEGLAREIENGKEQRIELLRDTLDARRLSPEGMHRMVALRNGFAHFREKASAKQPKGARQAALEFFKQALEFVGYLADDRYRVFPRVITVERLEVDRWGRRLVEALNDEGEQELIFTDDALEPGKLYFMHPVSNPMRVDPILVPAGDMNPPRKGKKPKRG